MCTSKPTLIICTTIIGKGVDEIAGTCAAHGEAGVKYVDTAKEALGLTEPWEVSQDTYDYFAQHKAQLISKYDEWQSTFSAWKAANPEKAKQLQDAMDGAVPDLNSLMPEFPADTAMATRNAGAAVLQPIGTEMPFYVSGSAECAHSTPTHLTTPNTPPPESPTI